MKNTSPHILLQELPFSNDVLHEGGMLYVVGGSVRDFYLNKESKDLDILITNIEFSVMDEILRKHGKIDMVGVSFGIIKFKAFGSTEDIDIAVPRIEQKVNEGHKGFEIIADPFLPIAIDLSRRDFTMNAIAMNIKGDVIDPFDGRTDIENKTIRLVNPQAFADDPLRMLRAVQFASRFNFIIHPSTFYLINVNVEKISEISGERILTEFEKIINKGDIRLGALLLVSTGLHKIIFDCEFNRELFTYMLDNIKSLAEFVFILCNCSNDSSEFLKIKLKGDIETVKAIRSISKVMHLDYKDSADKLREEIFDSIRISESILDCNIFQPEIVYLIGEFKKGYYPKSYKELAISGDDLIDLGIEPGIMMGHILKHTMESVLKRKLENKKDKITEFITNIYYDQFNNNRCAGKR